MNTHTHLKIHEALGLMCICVWYIHMLCFFVCLCVHACAHTFVFVCVCALVYVHVYMCMILSVQAHGLRSELEQDLGCLSQLPSVLLLQGSFSLN